MTNIWFQEADPARRDARLSLMAGFLHTSSERLSDTPDGLVLVPTQMIPSVFRRLLRLAEAAQSE